MLWDLGIFLPEMEAGLPLGFGSHQGTSSCSTQSWVGFSQWWGLRGDKSSEMQRIQGSSKGAVTPGSCYLQSSLAAPSTAIFGYQRLCDEGRVEQLQLGYPAFLGMDEGSAGC